MVKDIAFARAYPLETFKDSKIKSEIMKFFEKRNDLTYPKNLVIEQQFNRIGIRSLLYSAIKHFNWRFNYSAGIFSRLNFTCKNYSNEAHLNIFFQPAIALYKLKLLEEILNCEDFLIKPLYEPMRMIKMSKQINVFMCGFKPFLHNFTNKEMIEFIKEKCHFIKVDDQIGKLYLE
ncbi:MAG: threonine synthase [Candidatus Phytoplasma australasiaticum]|uniref:threonine synthase n=1 Tax=Candidatus Phytoplasma australasiaticum TaxID=2754999 RepID=UPI002712547C|nr:threonine synthase [Sweet potato little leaf phytoplasma]MDO8008953.1 threonine synthase [Sweet potato little leaf phytoplasma]MDV3180046.1 threonine synthase [Candidatus Phytoplasma australasiaticum]